MTCAICWDSMDMEEFQDDKDSTETCFKLDCEHAFHTKCIVMCLLKSKHSCPLCNKEKEPKEELEIVGLARKLCTEALRDPEISVIRHELYETLSDYQENLRQHKKRCLEAVQAITKEMKIGEYRSHLLYTIGLLKRKIKSKVTEMGPKYIGAALFKENRWDTSLVEKLILPLYASRRWRFYRLKHPRFYCDIIKTTRNK